MSKIRILHLITHTFMCKTHAIFEDTDQITNYYIYQKYIPDKSISFMKTGTQLLNNKDQTNHLIVNSTINKKMPLNQISAIISFIEKIKPTFVLLTNLNLEPIKIFKYLKDTTKIYFINHGITNQDVIDQCLKINKVNKNFNWSSLDGIFISKSELRLWISNQQYVDSNKIHLIPGLTQIDFLNKLDLNYYKTLIYSHIDQKTGQFYIPTVLPIHEQKKSILYVQNRNNTYSDKQQYDETLQILTHLLQYSIEHNFHLFFKLKHISFVQKVLSRSGNDNIKKLLTNPNITFIDSSPTKEVPLYYFLFCDVIVVQNYGTSLIEGLYANAKTIRVQLMKKDDVAGLNIYPELAQAFKLCELSTWLDKFLLQDIYPTSVSEKERQLFLEEHFGQNFRDKSSSEMIIAQIKKDLIL